MVWQYRQSATSTWASFPPEMSLEIEKRHKSGALPYTLLFKNVQVEVDTKQLLLKQTGQPHMKVRRLDPNEQYKQDVLNYLQGGAKPAGDATKETDAFSAEETSINAIFFSFADDVDAARKFFDAKMRDLIAVEDITLEKNVLKEIQPELLKIKSQFKLHMQRKDNKTFTLKGLFRPVHQAQKEIYELMRSKATGNYDNEVPDHWDKSKLGSVALVDVAKGSPEWTILEAKFKTTMAGATFVRVQRVQNEWQWEKYAFLKYRMGKRQDNKGEMTIFHGTRENAPACIYEGEDGFDMRYSITGMWGRGSYFAVNASYSNGYASTTQDGCKQMFCARVALGNVQRIMPNNSNLIKPPDGFDTVTGETGGSVVYIVYENGRAYPEHLITYK